MNPRAATVTRPKLDRDVVVDAALQVADTEGLDAVTIRRLAQDLSVTPMALYWHFKDKDALLGAVGDRMWTETEAELDRLLASPQGTGDAWAPLRLTMAALLTTMRRHPAIAPLVPNQVVQCEAGLSVTERTLAFLADRGFQPPQAAVVARFVLCSAVMLVDNQPGGEITEPGERAEVQRLKKIVLASLPLTRYPHIAASADYLTDCESPDVYFDEGVELVIAGVQHQAPPKPPARRRARSTGSV